MAGRESPCSLMPHGALLLKHYAVNNHAQASHAATMQQHTPIWAQRSGKKGSFVVVVRESYIVKQVPQI